MHFPAKAVRKFSAVFIGIIYFATNCAFAHSAEVNFWKERQKAAHQINQNKLAMLPLPSVIPAEAGIQASNLFQKKAYNLDPRFRGDDGLTPNIPLQFGTIRKVLKPKSQSPNSQTIIHIQDVHMNPEAQKNIGAALHDLIQQQKIDLIALEGAFAPIDLTPFRAFSDQDTIHQVADYLLRENKLSGPMHALLSLRGASSSDVAISDNTNDRISAEIATPREKRAGLAMTPIVIGIDDETHYRANVDAYRQSAPLVKSAKERLARLERELSDRKLKSFNKELAAFDARVQAYRAGTVKLGEYVKFVIARRPKADVPFPCLKSWTVRTGRCSKSSKQYEAISDKATGHSLTEIATPLHAFGVSGPAMTDIFLSALALESSLDFARVESERGRLLEKLLSKLNKQQADELVATSLTFRTGGVSPADFYQYVSNLCEKNGVPLAQFPTMKDYLRYILLSDSIDVEKLFSEVKHLEETLYALLAKTEEEKNLIAESKRLFFIGKLLDFALTKEEWGRYRDEQERYASGGRAQQSEHAPGSLNINLEPFESFYREADIRDGKMGENFLKAVHSAPFTAHRTMNKNSLDRERCAVHCELVVLVTGGFHSSGIDQQLVDAGFSVISFSPKITHIDDPNGLPAEALAKAGSAHLSVFSQEKTPLEKLFEGERLFLSPEVWSPVSRYRFSLFSVMRLVWLGLGKLNEASIKKMIEDLSTQAPRKIEVLYQADEVGLRINDELLVQERLESGTGRIVSMSEQALQRSWLHHVLPFVRSLLSFIVRPFFELHLSIPALFRYAWALRFIKAHPDHENLVISAKRLIGIYWLRIGTLIGLAVAVALLVYSHDGNALWVILAFHMLTHYVQMVLFPEAPLATKSRSTRHPRRWHEIFVKQQIPEEQVVENLREIRGGLVSINHYLESEQRLEADNFSEKVITQYGRAVRCFNEHVLNKPIASAAELEKEYLQLHAILWPGLARKAGEYDDIEAGAVVREIFNSLFSQDFETKLEEDPLGTIAGVYADLVNAQAFSDGNKRAASFILNCILMKSGHTPFVLSPDNIVNFEKVVYPEDESERVEVYWSEFKALLEEEVQFHKISVFIHSLPIFPVFAQASENYDKSSDTSQLWLYGAMATVVSILLVLSVIWLVSIVIRMIKGEERKAAVSPAVQRKPQPSDRRRSKEKPRNTQQVSRKESQVAPEPAPVEVTRPLGESNLYSTPGGSYVDRNGRPAVRYPRPDFIVTEDGRVFNLDGQKIDELGNTGLFPAEREKVTRILCPVFDGDFNLLRCLFLVFPNLKEVSICSDNFKEGTDKLQILLGEAEKKAGLKDLRIHFLTGDTLATAKIPAAHPGETLVVDIRGAKLIRGPNYRETILQNTKPGDLVLGLPFPVGNPSLTWLVPTFKGVRLPDYYDREEFQLWRLTEKDFRGHNPQSTLLAGILDVAFDGKNEEKEKWLDRSLLSIDYYFRGVSEFIPLFEHVGMDPKTDRLRRPLTPDVWINVARFFEDEFTQRAGRRNLSLTGYHSFLKTESKEARGEITELKQLVQSVQPWGDHAYSYFFEVYEKWRIPEFLKTVLRDKWDHRTVGQKAVYRGRHLPSSTGQEVYSHAFLLYDALHGLYLELKPEKSFEDWVSGNWDIRIDAFDISLANLIIAARGVYSFTEAGVPYSWGEKTLVGWNPHKLGQAQEIRPFFRDWVHCQFLDARQPSQLQRLTNERYDATFSMRFLGLLPGDDKRKFYPAIMDALLDPRGHTERHKIILGNERAIFSMDHLPNGTRAFTPEAEEMRAQILSRAESGALKPWELAHWAALLDAKDGPLLQKLLSDKNEGTRYLAQWLLNRLRADPKDLAVKTHSVDGRSAAGIAAFDFVGMPVADGRGVNEDASFNKAIHAALELIRGTADFEGKKVLLPLLEEIVRERRVHLADNLPGIFRAQELPTPDGRIQFGILMDRSLVGVFNGDGAYWQSLDPPQQRALTAFLAAKLLHETCEFITRSHPEVNWADPDDPELANTESVAYRTELRFLARVPRFLKDFRSLLNEKTPPPLLTFYRQTLSAISDGLDDHNQTDALREFLKRLGYDVSALNFDSVRALEKHIATHPAPTLRDLESASAMADAPMTEDTLKKAGPARDEIISSRSGQAALELIRTIKWPATLLNALEKFRDANDRAETIITLAFEQIRRLAQRGTMERYAGKAIRRIKDQVPLQFLSPTFLNSLWRQKIIEADWSVVEEWEKFNQGNDPQQAMRPAESKPPTLAQNDLFRARPMDLLQQPTVGPQESARAYADALRALVHNNMSAGNIQSILGHPSSNRLCELNQNFSLLEPNPAQADQFIGEFSKDLEGWDKGSTTWGQLGVWLTRLSLVGRASFFPSVPDRDAVLPVGEPTDEAVAAIAFTRELLPQNRELYVVCDRDHRAAYEKQVEKYFAGDTRIRLVASSTLQTSLIDKDGNLNPDALGGVVLSEEASLIGLKAAVEMKNAVVVLPPQIKNEESEELNRKLQSLGLVAFTLKNWLRVPIGRLGFENIFRAVIVAWRSA